MIHVRVLLLWDLWLACWLGLWHVVYCFFLFCPCSCWLALWHVLYCFFLFCLCSDVSEQRVWFSDGRKERYSTAKYCRQAWVSPTLIMTTAPTCDIYLSVYLCIIYPTFVTPWFPSSVYALKWSVYSGILTCSRAWFTTICTRST